MRARLVILAKDSLRDPAVVAGIVAAYRTKRPVLGVLPEGLGFRFIGQADLAKSVRSTSKGSSTPDTSASPAALKFESISEETLEEVNKVLPGVTMEEFAKAMFACFAVIALPLSCRSGSKRLLQIQVGEIHARLMTVRSMTEAAEDWSREVNRDEPELDFQLSNPFSVVTHVSSQRQGEPYSPSESVFSM